MRANTTLVEHDPQTGLATTFPAFTVLPEWLAKQVEKGNPGIVVDESEKPPKEHGKSDTTKSTTPATSGRKGGRKAKDSEAQTLASNTNEPEGNPFEGKSMAELEDLADLAHIDPSDFETKEALIAALVEAGAPTTITESPENPTTGENDGSIPLNASVDDTTSGD